MKQSTILSIAAASALTSLASAGLITVSQIGGGVALNSGPLASTVFGNGQSVWTASSLASVHTALNASGIVTDGKITFLAADTSAGLAFLTLVDRPGLEGAPLASSVHMDSIANGSNLAFLLDAAGSLGVSANNPGSRIATGDFGWSSNGGGDGFAWAGLVTGNTMTFRFSRVVGANLGLDDPQTFQFVTWTGSTWTLLDIPAELRSFTQTDDYGFAATALVPAPSVLMTGVGMLGIGGLRRRRSN